MLTLLFSIDDSLYAINTEYVVEVLPTVWIKPIAGLPNYVPGIVLLSGSQVPAVDFSQLVEKKQSQNKMHTRLILLSEDIEEKNARQVVIKAEKVTQIIEVADAKIFDKTVAVKEFPFFDGGFQLGSSMVRIIDVPSFFRCMEGVVF